MVYENREHDPTPAFGCRLIIYDEKKGKGSGVRVIDAETKEVFEYFARIIFVEAAALNSNLLFTEVNINPFS